MLRAHWLVHEHGVLLAIGHALREDCLIVLVLEGVSNFLELQVLVAAVRCCQHQFLRRLLRCTGSGHHLLINVVHM